MFNLAADKSKCKLQEHEKDMVLKDLEGQRLRRNIILFDHHRFKSMLDVGCMNSTDYFHRVVELSCLLAPHLVPKRIVITEVFREDFHAV